MARSPEASLCAEATTQAERALHIPDGFLSAMSRVESGRTEPYGVISAWPWTVNAVGAGHHYATREEAIAAVQMFHRQGIVSIDVGCMQVNLQQHPDAFSSLEQAFDPARNALYAGNFLLQMHDRTGSWPRAAAAYHSQTPGIGSSYQWKVLETWAVPQDERGAQAQASSQKNGQKALPSGAQASLPSTALSTGRHKPVMIAAPADGKGGAADAPPRMFHPFQGSRHFDEPAVRKPAMAGMRGRTLASYRAAPVALAMHGN
ncbi:transglycosylase SLT domain-containing protein [Komagataeibacter sp. FNDCR2]|uniref:transglycosylase SLT domain-containing protein n=1 Tax=Komagataeibacter sp. FNDCR2 TaxID=2878682 RepID=UPI001E5553DF|nr:transglycosylase SLT domain-containing protein [Komagataeibacter sp. FNDCR2]MCE2576819.1 transglycosylase SLT domain-containing protein [Komagataeibacter sp. FNDCR2]